MLQVGSSSLPGVYVIHNVQTHNFYVGSTTDLRKRWNLHKTLLRSNRHHSPHLQNAWNKYGESAFTYMTLAFVEGKRMRLAIEQSFLDTFSKSYNAARVATSAQGIKRSAATIEKLRMSFTPERRAFAAAIGKRPKTAEHRAKIAATHVGIRPTEQTREKLRAAWVRRRAKV